MSATCFVLLGPIEATTFGYSLGHSQSASQSIFGHSVWRAALTSLYRPLLISITARDKTTRAHKQLSRVRTDGELHTSCCITHALAPLAVLMAAISTACKANDHDVFRLWLWALLGCCLSSQGPVAFGRSPFTYIIDVLPRDQNDSRGCVCCGTAQLRIQSSAFDAMCTLHRHKLSF